MIYFTNLSLEFALDTLELVVGVDVVAEDDPCVRGEGAQVAVVDLGGGESDTSHQFIKFIKIGENRRPSWGSDHRGEGVINVVGARYKSSSSQAS